MSTKPVKQALFTEFARIAKAMANPHRLEILELLAQSERSVEDLARVAGLSMANASQHLQRLRQVGLVKTRSEAHRVFYSVADEEVIGALQCLRRVGERSIAEVTRLVETYLKVKDDLEPVPAQELLLRIRRGLVTVVDVRPAEEFAAGHLRGAINVPLSELDGRMSSLPNKREVVAYCRGPYCVLAFDAVSRLRKKGYRARRLENGFPEWKHAGLPVDAGG